MNITITDKKTDLASFEPVNGRYDADAIESLDYADIQQEIAAKLSAQHGFAVEVELFQSSGHAIADETPSAGNFIATRK